MMSENSTPERWKMLGYYGVLYLAILILIVLVYPLAQHYVTPEVSQWLPVNPNTSLNKTVIITTVFYWGYVAWLIFSHQSTTEGPLS